MTLRIASRSRRARWAFVGILVLVSGLAAGTSQGLGASEDPVDQENMRLVAQVPLKDASTPEGSGDLAFWGDYAVAARGFVDGDEGKNDEFILFDISDPEHPRQVARDGCTNSAHDVSIYQDLVILSQDDPTASSDCDAKSGYGTETFAGLRIFSIADPTNPVPVASVRTNTCAKRVDEQLVEPPVCDRGSHTHTVVPDLDNDRLVVYANGPNETIVQVPLAAPEDSKAIGHVTEPSGPDRCHDVQVLRSANLAACAAIDGVSLWDITDPVKPKVFSRFKNAEVTHHHSTVFSADGSTLVLSDETLAAGGAAVPAGDHCRTAQGGRLHFYDISATVSDHRAGKEVTAQPEHKSTFQIPDEVAKRITRLCYGHYASVVPLTRDIDSTVEDLLVVGWVGAGSWMIDFTDPSQPRDVAHYVDLGDQPGFAYASYWYNGYVYANNGGTPVFGVSTTRGLEVLAVTSRERDVRAALRASMNLPYLLPQTQP